LRTFLAWDLAVIEAQHARASHWTDPTTGQKKVVQGIASTWNYAEHYGILRCAITSVNAVKVVVDPGVWKAHMGVTHDKETSLKKARELWPESAHFFKRQKDHGRAEAALLAEYGRRFLPARPKLRL